MSEEWRPIPGYGGYYFASSHGQIKTVGRTVVRRRRGPISYPPRLMRQCCDGWGYRMVRLCGDGKKELRRVHLLVLFAWHGPRPEGMQGCHNDGNNQNNRPENLRWDTQHANAQDRKKHGHYFRHKKARETAHA